MASNDRVLLDTILEQSRAAQAPDMTADKFFEFFATDQILKEYGLSADEIKGGIVDGGGDGGIDAVYVFINEQLLAEDTDLTEVRRGAQLQLVCMQVKNENGFGEDALNRIRAAMENLLDLAKPLSSLAQTYNAPLLSAFERFRGAYSELALRFPQLIFSFFYACKGDEPHVNVKGRVAPLESSIRGLFSDIRFSFDFVTNRNLVGLARLLPDATRSLTTAQPPMQSKEAFIALVRLGDLFKFITDDGKLARHIFDSNVRDHQGKTEVNSEIQRTLKEPATSEEFWWLNNGVTVLSEQCRYDGTALKIKNPQIVNGVQSSTEIFNYFSISQTQDHDTRTILVRVLDPKNAASQDRIIRATNSQNAVAVATLRSTEKIHRDIEQYFKNYGLFYDRRKNFYRNEGRPFNKIVAIPYLAQAVMAVVLRRPGDARARPSSLLKQDDQYKKVFNERHPLSLYLKIVELMRKVDEYLYTNPALDRKDALNLRFYVGMLLLMDLIQQPQPKPEKAADIDLTGISDAAIAKVLAEAKAVYDALGATDQIAKGAELGKTLLQARTSAYVDKKKAGASKMKTKS